MIFVREYVKLGMELIMHKAFLHEDKTFLIFIKHGPTCLRMTLPTAGYAFLCQLAIKKMFHRHAHGKLDAGSVKKFISKIYPKEKPQ